jgi:CRP-like cAMP-binding protein
MHQHRFRNHLLSELSGEDLEAVAAHLEPLDLPRDFQLAQFEKSIGHYYLLEDGIASMVASSLSGRKAEIGLIGREGITPMAAIMGVDAQPFEFMMQVPGHGHRIDHVVFKEIMVVRPAVYRMLLLFCHDLFVQAAYTAMSNATHKIDVRLARWILMSDDRVDGDQTSLTHEFMAIMLGVRRSSVTIALHILEGEHLIYSDRGLVTIRDRRSLEVFAGGAYAEPEKRSYQRYLADGALAP